MSPYPLVREQRCLWFRHVLSSSSSIIIIIIIIIMHPTHSNINAHQCNTLPQPFSCPRVHNDAIVRMSMTKRFAATVRHLSRVIISRVRVRLMLHEMIVVLLWIVT